MSALGAGYGTYTHYMSIISQFVGSNGDPWKGANSQGPDCWRKPRLGRAGGDAVALQMGASAEFGLPPKHPARSLADMCSESHPCVVSPCTRVRPVDMFGCSLSGWAHPTFGLSRNPVSSFFRSISNQPLLTNSTAATLSWNNTIFTLEIFPASIPVPCNLVNSTPRVTFYEPSQSTRLSKALQQLLFSARAQGPVGSDAHGLQVPVPPLPPLIPRQWHRLPCRCSQSLCVDVPSNAHVPSSCTFRGSWLKCHHFLIVQHWQPDVKIHPFPIPCSADSHCPDQFFFFTIALIISKLTI